MKRLDRLMCVAMCCAMAGCASVNNETGQPPSPAAGEAPGYVGLSDAKLRVAFGAPAFVRKDGGDEMWRYDSANCKAFFFLYPQDGALTVRHVETLPKGADNAADPTCLDALRAQVSPPVS